MMCYANHFLPVLIALLFPEATFPFRFIVLPLSVRFAEQHSVNLLKTIQQSAAFLYASFLQSSAAEGLNCPLNLYIFL